MLFRMKEIEAPHCSLLAGETKMASEEHTRKYRLSTTLKPLILLAFYLIKYMGITISVSTFNFHIEEQSYFSLILESLLELSFNSRWDIYWL